jgi:hypothetical protein
LKNLVSINFFGHVIKYLLISLSLAYLKNELIKMKLFLYKLGIIQEMCIFIRLNLISFIVEIVKEIVSIIITRFDSIVQIHVIT